MSSQIQPHIPSISDSLSHGRGKSQGRRRLHPKRLQKPQAALVKNDWKFQVARWFRKLKFSVLHAKRSERQVLECSENIKHKTQLTGFWQSVLGSSRLVAWWCDPWWLYRGTLYKTIRYEIPLSLKWKCTQTDLHYYSDTGFFCAT